MTTAFDLTYHRVALRLGDRLRELREDAGLTLEQAGERAGMDKSAWHNIESGRRQNPTLTTLRAMAEALGISLEELFRGVNGDD